MKKFLKYFFTLGLAALTFAACEEDQPEAVNFTISGDSAFNASLEATVKVTGDKEAPSDIDVAIVLDNATTFPANSLSFPATVKVASGSKEATATVKISAIDALEGGKEYKAVFAAKVNDVLLQKTVTITYNKPEDPVAFSFTGDASFTDNKAKVKVIANKAVKEDVAVTITLDAKSTMPAEAITIPRLQVAKGATEAEGEVVLDPKTLTPGAEYSAVLNATVGNEAIGYVAIGFTKPDLNGKWSVIGLGGKWTDGDDIAMTADQDGWYIVDEVEAADGDQFKFRKDCKWDIALGLATTGNAPLDTEFEVVSTPGCPNIGIEKEGVYSLCVNPNAGKAKVVRTGDIVKVITLADLIKLMPETNNDKADFKGILNDVLVTYVTGSNVFLEDATAAMLLYKKNSGLQAGLKLSGYFEGKVQNFNNLPEISDLSYNQDEIKIEQAEVPAPEEMTIAQVLTNFDKLVSKRVKLTNVYAGGDIQKKGEYSIYQGEDNIVFYTNVDLEKGIPKGSLFDVTAIVTPYKEKKQVKIFEEAAIGQVIPHMTMSDILALCTSSSDTKFAGIFDGLYVNYILGTDHNYLEDASGAIRYYKSGGAGLKVGNKISGLLTGTCKLDSGRPTIDWLDFKYATVTDAPAEELPKPVTGTLASFTDLAGLIYRRVHLENVVLNETTPTDVSSFKTTISDDTGSIQLHVRFKPSQALPKGTKITFTGTFDVDNGKLEVRLFKENEITGYSLPQ